MDRDLNLFRELVIAVYEKHGRNYDEPAPNIQEVLDEIPPNFVRFSNSFALENALPRDGHLRADFRQSNQFLFLRPVLNHARPSIPILAIKSDFSRSYPEVRLKLGIFFLDSGDHLRATGYRFETPEGPGIGRHDYYHVQPIRQFYTDAFPLPSVEWLPDTHPTFFIDADTPVGLMLSLLYSVYGLEFDKEVTTYRMFNELKGYINHTRWSQLPKATFWKVRNGGEEHFYATRFDKVQLQHFCATQFSNFRNSQLTPIRFDEYQNVPSERRLIC